MNILKRSQSILVIASSGGHLTQAMCATSLVDRRLILVSNKNMLENDDHFDRIYTIRDTQYNPVVHALNFLSALKIFWCERPAAMFSTGGPICLPFAVLAKMTGTRFVFLDTMSRVTELSNSGKLISKFKLYDSFLCQWQSVANKHSGAEYHGQAFDLGDHGHQ